MAYKGTLGRTNWTLGEVSQRALGRFDGDKPIYKNGAAIIENWLVTQQGALIFRPGTVYAGVTNNGGNPVRFERFRYSINQEYVLEFGNNYLRFWANGGIVLNGGTPVQITTPFNQADLFQLEVANQADVMYITHPNYPPQKLIRTAANAFTISAAPIVGGPFLPLNATSTTITPSAKTGTVTLTASASIFQAGHVGSLWQINPDITADDWVAATAYTTGQIVYNGNSFYICLSNYTSSDTFKNDYVCGYWQFYGGVVSITTYTSGTVVTGTVQANPDGTSGNLGSSGTPTKLWAEGAFSAVRGYPVAVTFHEQRLVYGGTLYQGQTLWGSVVDTYDDFSAGQITDSDAYNFTVATNIVVDIRWLRSNSALKIGTGGGTITATDASSSGITPSSPPTITFDTDMSVQHIEPEAISGYTFYMQGDSYQLRQLIWDVYQNKDKSEDMTLLADHILRDGGGCVQIARQQSPNDRIWCVRADGEIAVFTRNPEQNVLAWSRIVAGYSSGGPGAFQTIAILPQDNGDDIVWVTCRRVINGTPTLCVEYFSTTELFQYSYQPVRMDCSSSIDNPIAITGISQANPCVITAPAHGLSNGAQVKIDNVNSWTYQTLVNGVLTPVIIGMGANINTNVYLVSNVTTNTFSLTDTQGNAINSTAWASYQGGGQVRQMLTTFSGLSYLNGEMVVVMVDGGLPASQQTYVVAGGQITLISPAATVHIGLPYIGTLQFLPLSGDGQTPNITKTRKACKVDLLVCNSLGGFFGLDVNSLAPIVMPNEIADLPAYHVNAPYSGAIIDVDFESSVSQDSVVQPILIQNAPLPFMLLGALIASDIYED
jgi:hypothetical protein